MKIGGNMKNLKNPQRTFDLCSEIECYLGLFPHTSEEFHYRSVVGMLLYLSGNTRPDITFAVSQVARFTHNPRKSHATALKMIVRYLSGTMRQP